MPEAGLILRRFSSIIFLRKKKGRKTDEIRNRELEIRNKEVELI